jgi:uncharacterized protein YbjT (DUF2867 family)
MILVVGATGLVGSAVCQKLAQRRERVRALVRSTSSAERVDALRAFGVELSTGDLKDPSSLASAMQGVDAVISTASSTLSRQPGDSIQSVDAAGQMNLVKTALDAKVERFIFVSFRKSPSLEFPLAEAKSQTEKAIQAMDYTIIQASYFMEVWLSPALGFDYVNGSAHIYGAGSNPLSWVSFADVAELCAVALRHAAARRATIEFGGPEALSPIEVVGRFQRITGKPFLVEHVPEAHLQQQYEQSADPMQKSFAALMLGYARGDAMDMGPVVERFGIRPSSVDDYVRRVTANGAAA